MRILIARYPVWESWLTFPAFYDKATRELRDFAEVDNIALMNPELPISRNIDISPYDAIVSFGGRFTETCLTKAPRLRIVAGFQCGEEILEREGIRFVELSGGWMRTVAELGIGLTLCCLRNIALWHDRIRDGHEKWIAEQATDDARFVHGELYGKRVGVFGFGRIGRYYATLAQAFGAELAAADPYVGDEAFTEAGVSRMELDDLITWSQILVIANSMTPESEGLIHRERVYSLPLGSCLIIISRAWSLDMQAVRERVEAGEIYLGADVFDVEPLPPNDTLRLAPNAVLTPHIAGRCSDSNRLMAEMVVNAFRDELLGEKGA